MRELEEKREREEKTKRKKEKVKAKSFDKLRGFKRIDFRT